MKFIGIIGHRIDIAKARQVEILPCERAQLGRDIGDDIVKVFLFIGVDEADRFLNCPLDRGVSLRIDIRGSNLGTDAISFSNEFASLFLGQRDPGLGDRDRADLSFEKGLAPMGGDGHVDHLDFGTGEKSLQHLKSQIVGAGMEMDGNWNVAQVLRMNEGRVGADHDRLADDGGALAYDQAAAITIVGAANLAPLAAAVELSLAELEKLMNVGRIHQVRIFGGSARALGSAHELNLEFFLREQPLVSGHEPRKGENGAAPYVAGNFSIQWSPRRLEAVNEVRGKYRRRP